LPSASFQERLGIWARCCAEGEPERILDQFLVEIGGRETAKDDRAVGMQALDDTRNLDRAVRMRQPVQVNAESGCIQFADAFFNVEGRIFEHTHRQIDDARADAIAFKEIGNGGEADGVHFKNRRRRHQVADRAVEDRLTPEVVDTGSMQQDKVRSGHIAVVYHFGGKDEYPLGSPQSLGVSRSVAPRWKNSLSQTLYNCTSDSWFSSGRVCFFPLNSIIRPY
jgi:hypothetical protein